MSLAKQTVSAPATLASSSVPAGLSIAPSGRMSQMQTEVLSRYQLAIMLPRNWLDVGGRLLAACDNPDFAKAAFYSKPVGGGEDKVGLNIRFAEEALRIMRNISVDTSPESEDEHAVHYRMTITDLESNTPTSETFRVSKTHETQFVDDDQTIVATRKNRKGEEVHTVVDTDDQLNAKVRAVTSKVKRALVLSIIPVDIRHQCLARCLEVTFAADKKDPAAALKSIISSFLSIGIDVADLKEYLGKPPQSATEKELQELRGIFALIREGDGTWNSVLSSKRERDAKASVVAKFVSDKQKEKAKQKAARNGSATAGAAIAAAATSGATDTTASAAPKRRGRPPAAAATAPATSPEKPAAPKPPRASLRDDDDDDGEEDTDSGQPAGHSSHESTSV